MIRGIRMADGVLTARTAPPRQPFFIQHHIGLTMPPHSGAAGNTGAVGNENHIVELTAAGAVVARSAAVQLVTLSAARPYLMHQGRPMFRVTTAFSLPLPSACQPQVGPRWLAPSMSLSR